jgi:hypothetical protein
MGEAGARTSTASWTRSLRHSQVSGVAHLVRIVIFLARFNSHSHQQSTHGVTHNTELERRCAGLKRSGEAVDDALRHSIGLQLQLVRAFHLPLSRDLSRSTTPLAIVRVRGACGVCAVRAVRACVCVCVCARACRRRTR